jgi:putative two-component system response regulator
VFERPEFHHSRILIVDDNPANVLLLERTLQFSSFRNLRSTIDPLLALEICKEWEPDLVILDLHMPGKTGLEVLIEIKELTRDWGFLPVLIFTADVTSGAKRKALEAGASDFLTKPGDATEIVLRVSNFLQTSALYKGLRHYTDHLEEIVQERTKELLQAQIEIVQRLSQVAEYHDDCTGLHAKRVGRSAGLIAVELGLSYDEASILELAATLHDLGKIGIPDSVLLKPGRLNPDEYEQMKEHTNLGANVLMGSRSKILKCAEIIALSHHERWDGMGYPKGLSGEDIPLYGRICAVADVFDALVSKRVYKEAMSRPAAIQEICDCSGSQFDPNVVAAFLRIVDLIDVEVLPLAA